MMNQRFVVCTPAVIAAALLASSCAGPTPPSHHLLHADATASAAAVTSGAAASSGAAVATSSAGLVKSVHAATARYHSTTQATKASYAVASPCVSHPTLGAMGFHWVNGGLVDPVFDPLQPEAVLYAPTPNGGLTLVAVEYIVIDVGQPAPAFDGHPFDVRGTPLPAPHWSLHVWVHRDNPNGIFTRFNPNVTCTPKSGAVETVADEVDRQRSDSHTVRTTGPEDTNGRSGGPAVTH